MRITKIGHCCLVIEEGGAKLLTDPGNFTTAQNEESNIDAILITHEHADHCHVPSLRAILKNNPGCMVVANKSVGAVLEREGIACVPVEDGASTEIKGISIRGFGRKHAVIYKDYGQVENTGFYIAETFFYPGDAFFDPQLSSLDVLALSVSGPWMKIAEALDYAISLKPRLVFPVHDGAVRKDTGSFLYAMVASLLKQSDVSFAPLKEMGSMDTSSAFN